MHQVEQVATAYLERRRVSRRRRGYPATNHLRTGHWERRVKRHRLYATRTGQSGFPILAGALVCSLTTGHFLQLVEQRLCRSKNAALLNSVAAPGREFDALNSPDFSARGAVTDEWITICKQLWFQSPASFDGGSIGTPIFAANLFPCRSPTPNLGRRGFPRRPAPHRPAWRWLASGRRGRGLAVTASRDARPSGDPETADGS